MENIDISEFKKNSFVDIIKELLKVNNGYVTSKLLTSLGIHRMYLKIMVEKGLIKKVGTGIYMSTDKEEDDYFIFSLDLSNVIYSHFSALFLQGFSKNKSGKFDITVCNNYFNYKLKKHNVFYVSKDIYELGLIEVKTKFGNKVKAYDLERSICDIIKFRKRLDLDMVKYSVKKYLKSGKRDMKKLLEYAKKLDCKEEVIDIVSLLYDGKLKDLEVYYEWDY